MGGNLCGKDRQSNCQAWALRRNKEEQWRRLQWRSGVTEASCTQMKMKAEGELHCRARTANKTHTHVHARLINAREERHPDTRHSLIRPPGCRVTTSTSYISQQYYCSCFYSQEGFFCCCKRSFFGKNMHAAEKCMGTKHRNNKLGGGFKGKTDACYRNRGGNI